MAVIAQQASAGGGTRFLRPLVRALVETFDDMHITVLVNSDAAGRFGASSGFGHERIRIDLVDSGLSRFPDPTPVSLRQHLSRLRSRLFRTDNSSRARLATRRLMTKLHDYDLVYLAWPFFLEPFDTKLPIVGTFHDFNYKHGFGSLGPDWVAMLEHQVPEWIARCAVCVTSSKFIGDELCLSYGDLVRLHRVIRLTTFRTTIPDAEAIGEVRARLGLPERYVVCPSNTSPHKNLGTLLDAYVAARQLGAPPLVLIGNGTAILQHADRRPMDSFGEAVDLLLDRFNASGLVLGHDAIALGYVADADADAIIAGADLLVAPSLYEAGSGPAVDAWSLDTPVAFSAIAPFVEHIECLGVDAELFDPTDPGDMAAAMWRVLSDPRRAASMVAASRDAMAKYTWTEVARGYRAAFDAALSGPKKEKEA